MPPPPSFFTISPTPYSLVITQAEFNGGTYGGIAKEAWGQLITTVSDCWGVFCDRGGTINLSITLYLSDGTTAFSGPFSAHTARYVERPTPGTYYIKISQAVNSDFDFTFTTDVKPLDGFTPPAGSLIINDDSNGPPATVYQLDGTLVGFLSQIPSGEIGAGLFTGEMIWQDRFNEYALAAGSFALFDVNAAYLTSVNPEAWGGLHTPAAASATDFYVVYKTNGHVWRISTAGLATGPIATLPTGSPGTIIGFGVNADGTIAYWSTTGNSPIHQHDLVTDTALPDLYPSGAGSYGRTGNNLPGEILGLPDGSVVTWIQAGFGSGDTLLHISDAGVLLNSFLFNGTYLYADHVTYCVGSESINLWRLADPFLDSGRFSTVDLATMAETAGFDTALFQVRVNLISDDPTVLAASESCSMVTYIPTPGPPPCPALASHPRIDGLPFVPLP